MTMPPVDPVPQSNVPVPAEVPTPIPSGSPEGEIRALAAQLNAPEPPQDLVRKGVVTALTLPTITITLSGDAVEIPGVVILDSYTPVVGDTCLIIKQGTDLFALGQINDTNQGGSGQGWATLAGSMQYRLVVDNGDNKVQLKGTCAYSATIGTLPTGFRPTVARKFVVVRDGEANTMVCTVNTTGTVVMSSNSFNTESASIGSSTTGGTSLGGSTGVSSGPSHAHSHGGTVPLTSFGEGHSHSWSDGAHSHSVSGGSHSHAITPTNPTNVWFDGTEFFL